MLLALSFLSGVSAEGQSFAVGGTAVTPIINHVGKIITFNVRLLLYPHCSGSQGICQITPTDVNNIKERITRVWNRGWTYSCYEVRVNIEVTVGTQLPPAGAG